MELIHQSHKVLSDYDLYGSHPLREEFVTHPFLMQIERAARTCYKSEDKIKSGSAEILIKSLISRGHHAMLEFGDITIRFITDRGVTHELVRHRICSFAQESTRYCNYKGGCTFVIPSWFSNFRPGVYQITDPIPSLSINERRWYAAMLDDEQVYLDMLEDGWTPQQARTVLPNSLKTQIVVKGNVREWRHILTLRTSKEAHPQMRALMLPLLTELQSKVPILFDDIGE